MPILSLTEASILISRIFLKFIGLVLISFLNLPTFWLLIYILAFLFTEVLEFFVFFYSRKYPKHKNDFSLILSFLNSFLVLFFIYKTNLTFTDFYMVGFLIVLASTVQGGALPGFISGITTATFYSIFLYREEAPYIYYLRPLIFFVLGILFSLILYIASKAVKEKEKVKDEYKSEIERLRDEFVAIASHNLLSPITALKGYLSILTSGKKLSGRERRFYLKRALVSSERLEGIVNELISVAILEKRDTGLFLAYTNLDELLNLVVDDFKLFASEKEIRLNLSSADRKLPKLLFDPRRIRQAISNLVSNAIKFTDKGGTVTVKVEKKGRVLQIVVSDSGIGIPHEKITSLFQKFYHAKSYLESYSSEGTGLGLYITKLIVTAHGGKVAVESQEGKGSAFTITLPIKT